MRLIKEKLNRVLGKGEYKIKLKNMRLWRLSFELDWQEITNTALVDSTEPLQIDARILEDRVVIEEAQIAEDDIVMLEVRTQSKPWYFSEQRDKPVEKGIYESEFREDKPADAPLEGDLLD